MLDLSKVEFGVDELSEEEVDMADVMRSIETLVRGRAERGRVALESEVGHGLPLMLPQIVIKARTTDGLAVDEHDDLAVLDANLDIEARVPGL